MFKEFKPQQGSCQSFKPHNLLQEPEAVSDLIDAVVSILPRVNIDSLMSALKGPQTINWIRKHSVQSEEFNVTEDGTYLVCRQEDPVG